MADLAARAASSLGLAAEVRIAVQRAGWIHDLGRLGVPNSIWDKPGPLTRPESERVRLHPYLTERMLAGTPALARLGAIAVQRHERLDGSGYPRGLAAITEPTLVLVGDRDHFSSVEEAATAYRRLRHGQLAIIPNTGHTITAAKIDALQTFLGDPDG